MRAQKDLIFARLHESTDAYWEGVIRTNVTGTWRNLRAELRQMVAQGRGGAIVNVGSIAGLTGLAGNPAYVATQARGQRDDRGTRRWTMRPMASG